MNQQKNQLRIVVPVSLSDVHLLEGWVNVFRAIGGAKGHPIEFHPTPSVAAAANDAAQAIKNFSGSVELFNTGKDYSYGWPSSCNAHFGHVMRSLASRRNGLPWLWAELDMLPMVTNWADMLIQEYVLTGNTGQMGVIMPMVEITNQGKPNEHVHINKADLYMVGVAVYDPNLFQVMGGISDQLWKSRIAFDMDIRYYTQRAWRSTNLISTASRTCNYRIEENNVVFDDLPDKKAYDKRAGNVPHGTILHHGCKDNSLAQLILGHAGRAWQTMDEMLMGLAAEVPKIAPAPLPPPPTQLPSALRPPVDEVKSDKKLAAIFATAKLQHPEHQLQTVVVPDTDASPEELLSRLDSPPSVTAEDLKKAVSEAAKPMQVANFAQQFKTTEDHIKTLAKQPESGVNIVGGTWVKLAK